MLDQEEIQYSYREYTEDPLSEKEIRQVLEALGAKASTVLRKNDKAYKALALSGGESNEQLITLMAQHPTLLQRPIGLKGNRAVVGRPVELLLDL